MNINYFIAKIHYFLQQGPSAASSYGKSIPEMCDRLKEEFTFLQAQTQRWPIRF